MQINQHANTLKFIGSLFVFFLLSISVQAQQSVTEKKNLVVYDPLLWKHQLKLNANQREKIQQINQEFYESIYQAARDGRDRSALQVKANQYIKHRSEEIWDAFNPNQRRKWKRMWDHYES